MALKPNDIISPVDVINKFITDVKNVIFSGTYDINNVPRDPTDPSVQCVPVDIIGNFNSIGTPTVGYPGNVITAVSVMNGLMEITKQLTRVGTFEYKRQIRTTYKNGWNKGMGLDGVAWTSDQYVDIPGSAVSGKILYTTAYERSLVRGINAPSANPGNVISVASVNDIIMDCLNIWNSTPKNHNIKVERVCHDVCHTNCHVDCYKNCHSDNNVEPFPPGYDFINGDGHNYCHADSEGQKCHTDINDTSQCHVNCNYQCHGNHGGGAWGDGWCHSNHHRKCHTNYAYYKNGNPCDGKNMDRYADYYKTFSDSVDIWSRCHCNCNFRCFTNYNCYTNIHTDTWHDSSYDCWTTGNPCNTFPYRSGLWQCHTNVLEPAGHHYEICHYDSTDGKSCHEDSGPFIYNY